MATTTATAIAGPYRTTRNVRLLFAYSFCVSFQLWLGIWIIYLTDFRGVTLLFVGLLETFFQLTGFFSRIPAGAFADRFTRRRSLIVAAVVEGAGLFLFGLAGNGIWLIVSYVLWAGGQSFRDPVHAAMLYDALAADDRPEDFAKEFGRLQAITNAGWLLGPLIGAPIAALTSLQVPVLLSIVSYGAALVCALLLEEPPRSMTSGALTYWRTIGASFGELRRDPAIRYLVLVTVGLAFAAAAQIILFQPFLQEYGVPLALFGLVLLPIRLLSIGVSAFAYVVSRTLGHRRAYGLIVFAPIVLLAVLALVNDVLAIVALGAMMVVTMLREPLFTDYMNRRTESNIRATVLSMRRLGIAIVLAVASPIAGGLGEESLQLAFLALGVAAAIIAIPAYVLWLRADAAGVPVAEGARQPAGDS